MVSRIPPPKKSRINSGKSRQSGPAGSLKIRLSGRDDAPLSIDDFKETLYAALQILLPHAKTHRIKRAALYLSTIDANGAPSSIIFEHDITLRPYDCAAESLEPKR